MRAASSLVPGRWAGAGGTTRSPGRRRQERAARRQFAHANCRAQAGRQSCACRPVPPPGASWPCISSPRGRFTARRRAASRLRTQPFADVCVIFRRVAAISLTSMSHQARNSADQARQMMASAQSSLPLCMTRTRSAAPALNPETTSRSASPSSRSVP